MLGIFRMVCFLGLFLIIAEVSGIRLIKKRLSQKNSRLTMDNFISEASPPSSFSPHRNVISRRETHKNRGRNVLTRKQVLASVAHSFLRQSTTEACGRTGDGQTDPFGLAAQFATSGRRSRDVELLEADPRAFGQFSRRQLTGNNNQRIIGGTTTAPSQICWQVRIRQ